MQYQPYGSFPESPVVWLPAISPFGTSVQQVPAEKLFNACPTFTALSLSIAPGDELVPFSLDYDGACVSFALTGGVGGRTYALMLLGKTPDGEVLTASVGVCCMSVLTTFPLSTPINPSFGDPAVWPAGCSPVLSPVTNLPPYTIAATGTTQLTAAVVPMLAIVLVNAGAGGGVLIGVPAATWMGCQPVVQNRSGGVVTLYPYSGDQFENLAVGAGIALQNLTSITLSVAQSGVIIAR